MNVFLVGNGFDLAHNLPTKYENFLHTIMFLIRYYTKDMTTVGHVFGNSQLRAMDLWINKCYECYCTGWNHSTIKTEDVEKLIDRANANMWFSYFSTVFDQDLGWIDFEREIARVISAFGEFFKTNKARRFTIESCSTNEGVQYILTHFSFFHDRANVNYQIPSPYSEREAKSAYCLQFPKGTGEWIINKEAIVEELYQSLDEFSYLLQEYLRIFVEQPLDRLLSDRLIQLNPNFQNADRVITFNYSSVFEKVYGAENVIHIHGIIDKKIVLGVDPNQDDDRQTVDTTFLHFKKYYQRVRYGTDIDYLNFIDPVQRTSKYSRNCVVSVIGHSLDITDKDIITEVFSLPHEIRILYHDERVIGGYIKNLINIYGKEGFDDLRLKRNLRFLPQTT